LLADQVHWGLCFLPQVGLALLVAAEAQTVLDLVELLEILIQISQLAALVETSVVIQTARLSILG
jgi:hypothetical protein